MSDAGGTAPETGSPFSLEFFRLQEVQAEEIVPVPADIFELVPMFLDSQRKNGEELVQLMCSTSISETEKYDRIAFIAHRIKGSGGSFGFDRITDLGRLMETAAHRRDAATLGLLLREYLAYVKRARPQPVSDEP